MSESKQLVDELARWDKLSKEAKVEIDKIKAQIQEIAAPDLENSKLKTVRYYGTNNNMAIITAPDTVKMVSYSFLSSVLGGITGDFIKQETNYKMSDPFKKIVGPLCTGEFIEIKLDDAIAQMQVDEKTANVLRKKLKGNPEKDRKVLESVGIDNLDHWVYFVSEAIAYEKIVKLLEVAGYPEGTAEFVKAMADLKLALIVEEGLKIGIEYEG